MNGTKSAFKAYSTHGQLKARLILAASFGLGVSLPRLTLDVKVFVKMHSNVVSGLLMFSCWSRERLLRMLCFKLYSRPSRPRDARCSGGKWPAARESQKFRLNSTPSISFKPLDWSLTNLSTRFPHKFRNSPTLLLTEILIWNENDSVKYGDFPDRSQSRSSRCWKLREAPKKLRRHWTGMAAN